MIKRYNNLSFVYGVPGIICQLAGNGLVQRPQSALIGLVVALLGTVLLMIGFAYYAMAKGRSPAWCLLGFLSCLGLIGLALLRDDSLEQRGWQTDGKNPPPSRPESGNPYQS